MDQLVVSLLDVFACSKDGSSVAICDFLQRIADHDKSPHGSLSQRCTKFFADKANGELQPTTWTHSVAYSNGLIHNVVWRQCPLPFVIADASNIQLFVTTDEHQLLLQQINELRQQKNALQVEFSNLLCTVKR